MTGLIALVGDFEDRRDEFPSGTNLRGLELGINGGLGDDLSYTVSVSFESGSSVSDAYVTYHGIKNTELSVGQVISPSSLRQILSRAVIVTLLICKPRERIS